MKNRLRFSRKINQFGFLLVMLLGLTINLSAQEIEPPESIIVDTLPPVVDTVVFDPPISLTTFVSVTDTTNYELHLSQNPTKALFKSMILPGWGQFGNKRRFKTLIFAGLDAWFIGSAIHYGRQASDFRDKYETETGIPLRNEWYALYEDRKEERNKFTWFAAIVTFISMFDAFADAHLSGFPQQDKKFSIDVNSTPDRKLHASLTLKF